MNYTNIFSLCFFILGLGAAHAQPTNFPVQSKAYILYNLHEFILQYENALNNDLRRAETFLYKQNTQTELYNDLPGGSGYVSWLQYRNTIEDIRARRDSVKYMHFSLEIAHLHNYGAYNVIQAHVLREINEIPTELTISLIHFKYESHYPVADKFKILKIEKRGDSYLPYAWHKPLIPDNASFLAGSIVNEPQINEGVIPVSGDLSTGFQAAFDVGYRIGGGREHAFLLKSGLGFSFLRSEYGSEGFNMFYDAIDRDNDAYEHEVQTTSISQELSLGFIDLPLGLSWRYFFPSKIKLELEGGLKASYLLSQNLSVLDGTITHKGHYDTGGHLFTLYDLPSYGFGTWPAQAGGDIKDFNPLALSLYGSLTYSHPVSKYVNLFISPYIRYGLNDLQSNKQTDDFAYSEGNLRSLTTLTDGFNILSYCARFGVQFSINNIDKSYVPPPKFRQAENRIRSRPAGVEYASKAKIIPGNLRISFRDAANTRHRLRLSPANNNCAHQPGMSSFPEYVPYAVRNDSLVIYKPFGYNIHPANMHFSAGMNNEVLVKRFNSATPLKEEYAITPLAPFNIFVIKMTDLRDGGWVVDENLEIPVGRYLSSLVDGIVDGECGYFLYQDETQPDLAGRRFGDCFPCRESDVNQLINHYKVNIDKAMPIDWLELIKEAYPYRTNAKRHIVNFHFIGSFYDALIQDIVNDLAGLDNEYINEINFHLSDIEQIFGGNLILLDGHRSLFETGDYWDQVGADEDEYEYEYGHDYEYDDSFRDIPGFLEYLQNKRPIDLKNIRFYEIKN